MHPRKVSEFVCKNRLELILAEAGEKRQAETDVVRGRSHQPEGGAAEGIGVAVPVDQDFEFVSPQFHWLSQRFDEFIEVGVVCFLNHHSGWQRDAEQDTPQNRENEKQSDDGSAPDDKWRSVLAVPPIEECEESEVEEKKRGDRGVTQCDPEPHPGPELTGARMKLVFVSLDLVVKLLEFQIHLVGS